MADAIYRQRSLVVLGRLLGAGGGERRTDTTVFNARKRGSERESREKESHRGGIVSTNR